MNRLTERDEYGNANIIGVDSIDLQGNLFFDEFNRVTEALNRLAYYEDLEEQGRLVELPVGVGQTVWFSMIEDGPTETTVYRASFLIQSDCIHVLYETEDSSGITGHFHGEAIGETVFLTRSEAEAALAARGVRDDYA